MTDFPLSLLPSFKGTRKHENAPETDVNSHGCTVHTTVVPDRAVPVLPGNTLAARVLVAEHPGSNPSRWQA
jgi:folate-dependent phosphoribosylglycinamide formyltransferase PurN